MKIQNFNKNRNPGKIVLFSGKTKVYRNIWWQKPVSFKTSSIPIRPITKEQKPKNFPIRNINNSWTLHNKSTDYRHLMKLWKRRTAKDWLDSLCWEIILDSHRCRFPSHIGLNIKIVKWLTWSRHLKIESLLIWPNTKFQSGQKVT